MVQTARFSDGQGGLRPVTLCFPLLLILALLASTGRVQAQTPTCEQDEATLRALLGKTAAEVDLIAQRALDNEHNCGECEGGPKAEHLCSHQECCWLHIEL
jgi:hypothetical protein